MVTVNLGGYDKLLKSELYWKNDFYILHVWDIKVVDLSFIYILLTLASCSILKH